jgi:hypothetical protein
MNREQWLQHAADHLSTHYAQVGVQFPPLKVSCSWPGGGSARKRIGECWPRKASRGFVNEIFISPVIEDGGKAISVLAHEAAHAVDDCAHGHRAPFTKITKMMGLVGKPTGAGMTPEAQASHLAILTAMHGPYPHRAIDLTAGKTKQSTRMIKCHCEACETTWRMAQASIDKAEDGLHCPVCWAEGVQVG